MDHASVGHFITRIHPVFEMGDPDVASKTSEAQHVEMVEETYRALLRGDLAALLEGFTDDVEFEIIGPRAIPFTGSWRGHHDVGEAIKHNFSLLESQSPEVLKVVAQGDTVIIFAREQGRYLPTGRSYDMHWIQMFTFSQGKICRFQQLCDSAVMLNAVSGPPDQSSIFNSDDYADNSNG